MTLELPGPGVGGVEGVDMHRVPQGQPHLPTTLLTQLVQSEEGENSYQVYH